MSSWRTIQLENEWGNEAANNVLKLCNFLRRTIKSDECKFRGESEATARGQIVCVCEYEEGKLLNYLHHHLIGSIYLSRAMLDVWGGGEAENVLNS